VLDLIHLAAFLLGEAHATAAGTGVKDVECEACGFHYAYQIRRRGRAWSLGFLSGDYKTGKNRARDNLRDQLKNCCEPVPCPECGWYQHHMIRRAKQLKYRSLVTMTLVFLTSASVLFAAGSLYCVLTNAIGGPVPFLAIILLVAAGGAISAAPVTIALKFVLSWLHDPNAADVESRRQLGRRFAINKAAQVS
jgi:hypothetical protein